MENKLKIFIDNIMLKLGLNKSDDIIPNLKAKLKDLKANIFKWINIFSFEIVFHIYKKCFFI